MTKVCRATILHSKQTPHRLCHVVCYHTVLAATQQHKHRTFSQVFCVNLVVSTGNSGLIADTNSGAIEYSLLLSHHSAMCKDRKTAEQSYSKIIKSSQVTWVAGCGETKDDSMIRRQFLKKNTVSCLLCRIFRETLCFCIFKASGMVRLWVERSQWHLVAVQSSPMRNSNLPAWVSNKRIEKILLTCHLQIHLTNQDTGPGLNDFILSPQFLNGSRNSEDI